MTPQPLLFDLEDVDKLVFYHSVLLGGPWGHTAIQFYIPCGDSAAFPFGFSVVGYPLGACEGDILRLLNPS